MALKALQSSMIVCLSEYKLKYQHEVQTPQTSPHTKGKSGVTVGVLTLIYVSMSGHVFM